MKKLILISALLFSFNGWADWDLSNKNSRGDITYIDSSSIRLVDDFLYAWVLTDWAYPQVGGLFYSAKAMLRVDCKLQRMMVMDMILYSQNMGKGPPKEPSIQDKSQFGKNWSYTAPKSLWEATVQEICSHNIK